MSIKFCSFGNFGFLRVLLYLSASVKHDRWRLWFGGKQSASWDYLVFWRCASILTVCTSCDTSWWRLWSSLAVVEGTGGGWVRPEVSQAAVCNMQHQRTLHTRQPPNAVGLPWPLPPKHCPKKQHFLQKKILKVLIISTAGALSIPRYPRSDMSIPSNPIHPPKAPWYHFATSVSDGIISLEQRATRRWQEQFKDGMTYHTIPLVRRPDMAGYPRWDRIPQQLMICQLLSVKFVAHSSYLNPLLPPTSMVFKNIAKTSHR